MQNNDKESVGIIERLEKISFSSSSSSVRCKFRKIDRNALLPIDYWLHGRWPLQQSTLLAKSHRFDPVSQ